MKRSANKFGIFDLGRIWANDVIQYLHSGGYGVLNREGTVQKTVKVRSGCRGVNSFLRLGGKVVMQRPAATGSAFYLAKIWEGELPPPPIDAPDL